MVHIYLKINSMWFNFSLIQPKKMIGKPKQIDTIDIMYYKLFLLKVRQRNL